MQDSQNNKLVFLKERIKEIKVALFKAEMKSELQLPNNIIETLKVEEDGTIWFFTTCYGDHAGYLDKSFYAYLNYYKKGSGFHLQIAGNAFIVECNNHYPFIKYGSSNSYNYVLIKMNILQAEIFENRVFENTTWAKKITTLMNNFFLPAAHRSYNFSLSQIERV